MSLQKWSRWLETKLKICAVIMMVVMAVAGGFVLPWVVLWSIDPAARHDIIHLWSARWIWSKPTPSSAPIQDLWAKV